MKFPNRHVQVTIDWLQEFYSQRFANIFLDPARRAFHFNLAHTLGERGWWNRAAAQYRQAIQLRPEDHSTSYNMARALHEWGDYRGTVETYLEVITLALANLVSISRSARATSRLTDRLTR